DFLLIVAIELSDRIGERCFAKHQETAAPAQRGLDLCERFLFYKNALSGATRDIPRINLRRRHLNARTATRIDSDTPLDYDDTHATVVAAHREFRADRDDALGPSCHNKGSRWIFRNLEEGFALLEIDTAFGFGDR